MAEIYIYSSLSLRRSRGSLEDDLEDFLKPIEGEITGGGAGNAGWNIDVEIDEAYREEWIPRIKAFLQEWRVPTDTYFSVYWSIGEEKEDESEEDFDDSNELSELHYVYPVEPLQDEFQAIAKALAERIGTKATGKLLQAALSKLT